MKKYICYFGISFLLLFFASCMSLGNSHLNFSAYGESFRAKNKILFPNVNCEHTLTHTPFNEISDPSFASRYHQTSCKWGGCDYEAHEEPHTFLFRKDELPMARAHYKENGYLYHSFNMACEECHGAITLHVLCQTQDSECGAGIGTIHAPAQCFIGCDWNEIFADTPYRIVIKSAE